MTPKVADFGLSRKLEEGLEEHNSKSSVGPVRWYAPECIKRSKFSEKSDVWAYAVTIGECDGGKVPYGNKMRSMDVAREVIAKRGGVTFEGLDLPDTIEHALSSCFAFHPRDRPTFAHLVSTFEDAEAEDEVVYASLARVMQTDDGFAEAETHNTGLADVSQFQQTADDGRLRSGDYGGLPIERGESQFD
jgi:serine/threonine protein kinase